MGSFLETHIDPPFLLTNSVTTLHIQFAKDTCADSWVYFGFTLDCEMEWNGAEQSEWNGPKMHWNGVE